MALLGLNGKLYYNTGGAAASTGWLELERVKDVTLNTEKAEADVTTRKSNGWRQRLGTLKEGTVEWEMNFDPNDAGFLAIQTAFFGDTTIGLEIFTGDRTVAGTEGLRGDFSILNFGLEQALEEAQNVPVSASLTDSDTAPEWVKIT